MQFLDVDVKNIRDCELTFSVPEGTGEQPTYSWITLGFEVVGAASKSRPEVDALQDVVHVYHEGRGTSKSLNEAPCSHHMKMWRKSCG